MTKNEFINKIENGRDIMFDIVGRHFTILTWTDEGILIDEQYPNDNKEQCFETPEELVENYKIDGIPLAELTDKVVITDYS